VPLAIIIKSCAISVKIKAEAGKSIGSERWYWVLTAFARKNAVAENTVRKVYLPGSPCCKRSLLSAGKAKQKQAEKKCTGDFECFDTNILEECFP
jgi:hypothetical protein